MHEDPAHRRPVDPARLITTPRRVHFLLARPTENADRLPATIGERDVFGSEESALDALDVHYSWCAARHGGYTSLVRTAQWYVQSAMVGPRITPSLGDVYLALSDDDAGDTWAVAGGFLATGEVIHWSSFVSAVRPFIPIATGDGALGLAYRGDADTHFHQLWFAPLNSRRVYPKRIVVDADDAHDRLPDATD